VSLIKTITSAFGKMAIVAALLGAFLVGLVSVVWLSLRGDEIKVPEVIGKDVLESEKELAALGLKLKRRANRFSEEKPNTVLEQLPKSGETVKTGQVISVVVSRINPEGSEEPAVIEKDDNTNSAGTAVNPDAPVNKKKEVKKPVSMTRDVESTKTNKNSNVAGKNGSTTNKNGSTTNRSDGNKTNSANTAVKANTAVTDKPAANKPPTNKPAANTGGDIRPRKVPQ
jgi:beta-lactam-binding protein with PASTA domain